MVSCGSEGVRDSGGPPVTFCVMEISADDEDDSVEGCEVSPDVLEGYNDVCATLESMLG